MKKRLLALILAAVTVMTFSFGVFAAEDSELTDETYETGITCEYFSLNNVIVICYDDVYTRIENAVKARINGVDWENDEVYVDVSGDGIVQKVYEYEDKMYPQVFICMPEDANIFDIASVEIEEGAFSDENGNLSNKVKYEFGDSTMYASLDVLCTGNESVGVDESLNILVDSSVNLEAEIDSDFADVWKDDLKFEITSDSEKVELKNNSAILSQKGTYTASCSVNDILCSEKSIKTVGRTAAYFITVGESLGNALISPFTFIYSLFYFIFLPGPGTVVGGLGILGTLWSIPQFFIDLFTGPATEVLTF